jgi:cytochrome c peroxidase
MKGRAAGAAGIGLLFAAKPCCTIPAALSAFGVTYTGLTAVLAPYRPLLLAASALCLALSGWFALRSGVSWLARSVWVAAVAASLLLAFHTSAAAQDREPPLPLGLPRRTWPAANPYSLEKARLGWRLFFEGRLSRDGTVSCATCHDPARAFTDGQAVSRGIGGRTGTRSAPTILNRVYGREQFWDGRAATLEEQIEGPIRNPAEMASSPEECVRALERVGAYRELFLAAFGNPEITFPRIAQAIATFERTLVSGNSPYDRFRAGDPSAMSPAAVRGEKVFRRAGCDRCHFGSNFTDGSFANVGVGALAARPDTGRYAVLGRSMDWGTFKVPTLREVARTAPYMHDGSLATLEDVVAHYDHGGTPNVNLDRRIRPLGLTRDEKAALVEFLRALSGEGWQHVAPPEPLPDR